MSQDLISQFLNCLPCKVLSCVLMACRPPTKSADYMVRRKRLGKFFEWMAPVKLSSSFTEKLTDSCKVDIKIYLVVPNWMLEFCVFKQYIQMIIVDDIMKVFLDTDPLLLNPVILNDWLNAYWWVEKRVVFVAINPLKQWNIFKQMQ